MLTSIFIRISDFFGGFTAAKIRRRIRLAELFGWYSADKNSAANSDIRRRLGCLPVKFNLPMPIPIFLGFLFFHLHLILLTYLPLSLPVSLPKQCFQRALQNFYLTSGGLTNQEDISRHTQPLWYDKELARLMWTIAYNCRYHQFTVLSTLRARCTNVN